MGNTNKLINILVRTSKRPNYFNRCYKSIKNQTYKKIHLIVNYDNNKTLKYLKYYQVDKITPFRVKNKNKFKIQKKTDDINCHLFLYNLYFNYMYQYCKPGYIIFMDDDDILNGHDSLSIIANNINDSKPLLFWKVILADGSTVPSQKNFGNKPVCMDITGQGFAFPTEFIKYAQWDPYKMSDYRIAKSLWQIPTKKVFINKPLIKMDRNIYGGHGRKDDLGKFNAYIFKMKIKKIFQNISML